MTNVSDIARLVAGGSLDADPAETREWLEALDALVAAAIIWLHRANIRRLLNGTESRFGRRAVPPAHP